MFFPGFAAWPRDKAVETGISTQVLHEPSKQQAELWAPGLQGTQTMSAPTTQAMSAPTTQSTQAGNPLSALGGALAQALSGGNNQAAGRKLRL